MYCIQHVVQNLIWRWSLKKAFGIVSLYLLVLIFVFYLYCPCRSELASRVMQEVICKVLNTMSTVKRHAPLSVPVPQQDGDDSEGEEIDDEDIDEAVEINEDNTDSDEVMDTEEIQNSFKVSQK